jgi:hypothetical protein
MSSISVRLQVSRCIFDPKQRALNNEQGASFIEFIVAIPFLFFLVFGAVDLGRVLDRRQAATALATMISMKAKRECVVTKPFSGSAAGPRSDVFIQHGCLDAIFQNSNTVIPDAQIIVSLYKLDLDTKRIELWQTATNYSGFKQEHSRYSENYFATSESMLRVLGSRGDITEVDNWYNQNALLLPGKLLNAVIGIEYAYAHGGRGRHNGDRDDDRDDDLSGGVCSPGNAYGVATASNCNKSQGGKPPSRQSPPVKPAATPAKVLPPTSPYLSSADNNVVVITEIHHRVGAIGTLGFFGGALYEVAIF